MVLFISCQRDSINGEEKIAMRLLIQKIHQFGWAALVGWTLSAAAADQDSTRAQFNVRYETWKTWVHEHRYLSDYTTCPEYDAMVALGLKAIPFMVEKMEQNPEDFHLEVAIHVITKKRFPKSEWPAGRL